MTNFSDIPAVASSSANCASASAAALFNTAGDMAIHFRNRDWSSTSLGSYGAWPQKLVTLLEVVLCSRQPMFIAWGPRQELLYNEAYAEILAFKHPAALGNPLLEIWSEIRDDLSPIVTMAYGGQAVSMDDIMLVLHRRGHAEETHFSFSYTPLHKQDGQVGGFLCACTEITDQVLSKQRQQHAEEALCKLNETLEQEVEQRTEELNRLWVSSPDLLLVMDFKGFFLRVNPAWSELLGYQPHELIGHHVNEFVVPDDHHDTVRAYTLAANGGLPRLVNRYRHKDGSVRWISWAAAPAGDLTYATGRDITSEKEQAQALKQAEEALRQSQKLDAIGQLTGGVAHDFNNLLTVIKSSADMLNRPALTDARRARYIGAISETVDRAAKLTAQLLAFARRQALKPEVFDVCESVRSLSSMIRTLVGSQIEFVTDLPDLPCLVKADPTQFDTAVVNLAINARDAMNGGGRLTIKVEKVEGVRAIRDFQLFPGAFVAVSIIDTGHGISPRHLDQVFEPFFTTKGVGQGAGLGLSQVFGFAKQSAGETTVDSTEGFGSTFTVYLPRIEQSASAQVEDELLPMMDGHGLRVLVVEDNVDVGAFALDSLTDLGYLPVLANNAEQALLELAKDASRFDIVFSDVVMPGMNGIDLAHHIRDTYQGLPVLLASGYSDVLAKNGTSGFELLHKPYSIEDLSRLLRRVCARQRQGLGTGRQ